MLIGGTDMHLSEDRGLLTSNICFNGGIPHINLVAHPWWRLQKGLSSGQIPLAGLSR